MATNHAKSLRQYQTMKGLEGRNANSTSNSSGSQNQRGLTGSPKDNESE